jgi:hypothetical protein
MIAVAFIAFLLFQYVGDPVVFLLGQDAKPEQIREMRAGLGLDKPFFVQFWHFLVNASQGEFGLSLRQGAKVSRLIGERFPATLELALVAAVLALFIGIPDGRLHRPAPWHLHEPGVHDRLAAWRVAAHLPDRHPADPRLRGHPGLVPELRPRRHREVRLVDQRPFQRRRLATHRAAGGDARDLPAHADHAAGARRDARGAAHRLHQGSRAHGACRTAPSISATPSRTRWCR